MKELEMSAIADLIATVLQQPEDQGVLDRVRAQVQDLCTRFPLYGPAA
jgi:glycine hydroxymethyltransferase